MNILPLQLAVCVIYYESDPFFLIIPQHPIDNSGIYSFLTHTVKEVMTAYVFFFFRVVSQDSTSMSCSIHTHCIQ